MLSPSTRRAWIEIFSRVIRAGQHVVALHPEGVDRNRVGEKTTIETLNVALHPEGVDRNSSYAASRASINVALHPEGVDRNLKQIINVKAVPAVALHPEGVDRNFTVAENEKTPGCRPPPGGRG